MYYEEKIEQILIEFKELFNKMLNNKYSKDTTNEILFIDLLLEVKTAYPELNRLLNRVCYYYSEVDDSEEKLEFLMLLYNNIKEAVYGK